MTTGTPIAKESYLVSQGNCIIYVATRHQLLHSNLYCDVLSLTLGTLSTNGHCQVDFTIQRKLFTSIGFWSTILQVPL